MQLKENKKRTKRWGFPFPHNNYENHVHDFFYCAVAEPTASYATSPLGDFLQRIYQLTGLFIHFLRCKNSYIVRYALFLRLENDQKSCVIRVYSFLEIALFRPDQLGENINGINDADEERIYKMRDNTYRTGFAGKINLGLSIKAAQHRLSRSWWVLRLRLRTNEFIMRAALFGACMVARVYHSRRSLVGR